MSNIIRSLKYVGLGTGAVTALIFMYVLALQFSGNLHAVAGGAIYRSAQPTAAALRRYTHDLGIKTVVNLREAGDAGDTDAEAATARALGLTYVRYPLSARRLLDASEITGALEVLKTSPKPILVHSYFGSDRAGLISALYLMRLDGRSAEEASRQLSPKFGHLPYLGNPTVAMDRTFAAVADLQAIAP